MPEFLLEGVRNARASMTKIKIRGAPCWFLFPLIPPNNFRIPQVYYMCLELRVFFYANSCFSRSLTLNTVNITAIKTWMEAEL